MHFGVLSKNRYSSLTAEIKDKERKFLRNVRKYVLIEKEPYPEEMNHQNRCVNVEYSRIYYYVQSSFRIFFLLPSQEQLFVHNECMARTIGPKTRK